ncbi:hypothetical protein ACH4A8_39000 [Streptomyces vietnamensis]|uniref:hypothetical protein n=1 Tax=Streptomyces vietnamensis TaxID=362257 RepID=UPI00379B938E
MDHVSTPITPDTARHVLWTFGRDGGFRPGSFTQKLIELIAMADQANTVRLGASFPEVTKAVALAKYSEDGIDQLQQIAVGEVAA